jgi:hypothetical protein
MNFLILLGGADHFDRWDAADDELRARSLRDYTAFAAAVRRRGRLLVGDALTRPETARTVRPGESRIVTDGPFAETVEQLGGFYLIDVADLDTAVDLARLLPRECVVEVRATLGIEV